MLEAFAPRLNLVSPGGGLLLLRVSAFLDFTARG